MAQGITPTGPAGASQNRRTALALGAASVVIGLSVVLSYNWSSAPGARMFEPLVLLFGVLVAAFIALGALVTKPSRTAVRVCPACGRQAPGDSNLCSYCGHRFL